MIGTLTMENLKKLTASITLIGLAGCGAFTTKDKGAKASQNDPDLSGEWRDECAPVDILGTTHRQTRLRFSSIGDFERYATLYNEENCTNKLVTFEERGTYQALGRSSEASDADDINFSVTTAQITPENEDAASMLNNTSLCGYNDWKAGESRSVLGRDCLGHKISNGDVIYDVYRLTGDDEYLTLGKSAVWFEPSMATTRPSAVNQDRVYEKQ